ncbi:hypothetical protein LTR53_001029 [Teratosphaeriaceae sp. CCFEE 6253]|nr:hypothetical protein LTR53_001029 [Teratosphaeriaceae sp. CCFEE 6253]
MKTLIALSTLAACALALPSSSYVLHEAGARSGRWKRSQAVDPDAIVPLRIGLKQRNLHIGYDKLMEVAHPSSERYSQHLSAEDVRELFAPRDGTVEAVTDWLLSSGINGSDVMHYENKGWLGLDIPARDAQRLFRMQYHEHEGASGEVRLGCDRYYVPAHLAKHIDYITPGVKLSAPMKKRSVSPRSRGPRPGRPGPVRMPPGHHRPWHPPPGAGRLPADLQDCARNFTTQCYRALYDIPFAYAEGWNVSGNSLEDLDLYIQKYAPFIPAGTGPIALSIDGATLGVPAGSELNTGESDIDLGVALPLIYPQTITIYQTDDDLQYTDFPNLHGFLNTFLDALDGSYCNYTAYGITGDSPGVDPQYPDPLPGGYKGQVMCGTYTPTRVISISYGEAEADLPLRYTERQCNEWMKLGLMGHSVFVASGDNGVANYVGDPAGVCLSAPGQNNTIFSPSYPNNCPYVTNVGGTQFQWDQTILDPESAMQDPPLLDDPGFSSGGGFANYFPMPAYQVAAVSSYFQNHDPGYPYYVANANASNIGAHGGLYNRAGRAYPDVSANGASYRMFDNLTNYHFFGTSLSSPLWGAITTLINEERGLAGKGPVGFVNPTLYAHPWALTDIVNGSNPGCGSEGFHAVPGWDPVTGLGTLKYPALLRVFMGLP